MASLGSYIRSAARATFSAYRRVPIRWRLAGGSAALTLVILAGFAAIVGTLTSRQVRGQFNDEVRSAVDQLYTELNHKLRFVNGTLNCNRTTVHLSDYASAEQRPDPDLLLRRRQPAVHPELDQGRQEQGRQAGKTTTLTPSLFPGAPQTTAGTFTQSGYRVAVRSLDVKPAGTVTLLYARPLSDVDHTLAPGPGVPAAGRARRHHPGAAGRPGHRPAGDAPDRRADRRRARDRAHPRRQRPPAPPRGR